MKKIFFSLLLTALILPVLALPVLAADDDIEREIEEFAGTQSIFDGVDAETKKEAEALLSSPSPKTLFQFLLDAILPGIRSAIPFFFQLIAILLCAALFRAARSSFGKGIPDGAFDLTLILVFSLASYFSLKEGLELCGQSLMTLSSIMIAGLPAMTMLTAMAGNASCAALQGASLSFFVTGASSVYSSLLFPAVKALFALFCAGSLTQGDVMPLFNLGKKTVKIATVLGFTLIGAMLGLQNALALSRDTLAMRSVRFAAGNFIPVVGSLVGENSRAMVAALGAVKTRCGVGVIVVILLLALPPILSVLCKKLMIGLAGAAAGMLGEDKLEKMMRGLSELYDLLCALLVSQGSFFIFYIALFMKGVTS